MFSEQKKAPDLTETAGWEALHMPEKSLHALRWLSEPMRYLKAQETGMQFYR